MLSSNSPTAHPPQASAQNSDRDALKKLKTFLTIVVRRAKGFFQTQTLPHVANKACEIYLGEANPKDQARCRRMLRTRLSLNPLQLRHFFRTPMGSRFLDWFVHFFHLPSDRDPQHTLQDLLVQMAADPDGLSILSFLRCFPDKLQFNLDQLLFTAKRVELLLRETDDTVSAIQNLAIAEAELEPLHNLSTLPDLRNPGPFSVKSFFLWIDTTNHLPPPGLNPPPSFRVCCYQPQPWPDTPVPIIVQSHGLASSPEDVEYYAQHLASHGYFVVAPRHSGSDVDQIRQMLAGATDEVFRLAEFVDRPLTITALLNELARRNTPDFAGHLDVNTVGVMGYSFGAYTAFALAGADIHFEKLETACGLPIPDPNPSLLLQCEALALPRQTYNFHDDRIKAIVSIDSVGSEVFGAEGIATIKTPVLLMAGSHDTAAPLVFEQIRMFHWLTTPHHHLALMQGKSHIRDMQRLLNSLDLQAKISSQGSSPPKPTPFDCYIKALSTGFFKVHLNQQSTAAIYLTARYANFLSQSPFNLWLISQASHSGLADILQILERERIPQLMELPSVTTVN